MPNTAPAPNVAPTPGMCPGVAVLSGGGGAGGANGGASGNGGENGGNGSGNGDGANPDDRGAASAGEPIDVITGRVFTLPITDLALPGPLPFSFTRVYSSALASTDLGLGFGWAFSLGWRVEVRRTGVRVWSDQGIAVSFDGALAVGEERTGRFGWLLRREAWGFSVDAGDRVTRAFTEGVLGGGQHALSALVDSAGNRITLRYEGGCLAGATDSVGREIRFAQEGGRITAVEVKNAAAQGRWVAFARYEYDADANLVKVTDADGHAWTYAYDSQHRLTAHTDRTGQLTFHYVYDREGRAVESWGARTARGSSGPADPALQEGLPDTLSDGETPAKGIFHVRIEYGPNGYREVLDSRGLKRYFGNALGLVDKLVDGTSVVESRYDERGFVIAETDAVGATYRYERDARGRVLKKIDPYGRVTAVERDAAGLVVRAIDAAGAVTEITRDARGLPVRVRDPVGAVSRMTYDERGSLVEVHDPLGGARRHVYDAHGNVVQMTEQGGAVWRTTYDFWGRVTSFTAPTGATIAYRYSNRGDLLAKTAPDGATSHYRYDEERHLVEQVNPGGGSVKLGWGGYHSICSRTDESGRTMRLAYDRECDLVAVVNERGETHTFDRNALGNIREERTFDGRRLRYRYDAMGRLVRTEGESGATSVMELGLAGEVLRRTGEDGTVETFVHDARGLIEAVESGGVKLSFERDRTGRIVREVQEVDGDRFAVDVHHDIAGRRIGRRTSRGHVLELSRDAMGDVRGLRLDGNAEMTFARDGLGRETVRMLGGGGRIDTAFDIAGRLVRRATSRGAQGRAVGPGEPGWVGPLPETITADAVYRYDITGDLSEVWRQGRGRTRFEHDATGRLLAALNEDGTGERFAFDPTDNLFERGEGAPTREYGPGNRLLRRGDCDYVWDADGRLAEKRRRPGRGSDGGGDAESGRAPEVTRYRWNGKGLLASVERPDGVIVAFRYDAFARRVEKRISRTDAPGKRPKLVSVTRFHWDRHVPVHEVTRAATGRAHGAAGTAGSGDTGAIGADDPVIEERTYVFEEGSFEPLAQRTGSDGEWLTTLNDQIGTPEKLVDARGDVVGELRLSTWGAIVEEKGQARTPLRFQGQYADEETGLSYNRHRYYDPEMGRFISPDPIGLWGHFNSYSYVTDATSAFDPIGHKSEAYGPSGLSPDERQRELLAARQRYLDRGLNDFRTQLINRANAEGKPHLIPNTGNCGVVARSFDQQTGFRSPDVEVNAQNGSLKYYSLSDPGKPGAPTMTQGGWNRHHVNMDPQKPGGLIDHDQGFVWDNPQQMTNAMFTKPITTSWDPPHETPVAGDFGGGGSFQPNPKRRP